LNRECSIVVLAATVQQRRKPGLGPAPLEVHRMLRPSRTVRARASLRYIKGGGVCAAGRDVRADERCLHTDSDTATLVCC
jgi:hypothetical protein